MVAQNKGGVGKARLHKGPPHTSPPALAPTERNGLPSEATSPKTYP